MCLQGWLIDMDKNSAFNRKYSFQKIKNFHKHQPQWERRPFYAWGNADLETNQLTGDNKGTRHVNSNCWEKTIPLGKCGLIFETAQNEMCWYSFNRLSWSILIMNHLFRTFHSTVNIIFFHFLPLFGMEMHSCFIQDRNFNFGYVLCRLQEPIFNSTLRKEPNGMVYMSIYASRKGRAALRGTKQPGVGMQG